MATYTPEINKGVSRREFFTGALGFVVGFGILEAKRKADQIVAASQFASNTIPPLTHELFVRTMGARQRPDLAFPIDNVFTQNQKNEITKQVNISLALCQDLFGTSPKNVSLVQILEQTTSLLALWGRTNDFKGHTGCALNEKGSNDCAIYINRDFDPNKQADRGTIAHETFHVFYGGEDYIYGKIERATLRQLSGALDIRTLFDEEGMAAFVGDLIGIPVDSRNESYNSRWRIHKTDPDFFPMVADRLFAIEDETLTHEQVMDVLLNTKSRALPIIFFKTNFELPK